MIALIDTNVVLDVLLKRAPHHLDSTAVIAAVETGRIQGLLGATTVTTIHYLLQKSLAPDETNQAIALVLRLFEVAPITRMVLESALESSVADYEDAVLEQAAMAGGATCIVTRNVRDFDKATIRAYSPTDFLKFLK